MSGAGANIRDVASRAGVSTGTVSRVLGGAEGVRPDNAKRVEQAVRELGYTLRGRPPLGSGRAPQRRKTGNIGFYLPQASSQWAQHPMFNAVFHGLNRACEETGFHYLTEYGDSSEAVPRMVVQKKIDGLLVKGGAPSGLEAICKRMPVVGVNQNQPGLPFDQINCDDYHSGYTATEHLWKHGHRRIGFLTNVSHHPMLFMRYQGYERFLRAKCCFDTELVHLPTTHQAVPSAPETSYTRFDDTLSAWWSLPAEKRPTAVVAANDWNAAGLYLTAERLGISIPDELSVIAFDNSLEICKLLKPNLTSFEVALEEATYLAMKRLAQQIDDGASDGAPITQSVTGKLVVRNSVCTLNP